MYFAYNLHINNNNDNNTVHSMYFAGDEEAGSPVQRDDIRTRLHPLRSSSWKLTRTTVSFWNGDRSAGSRPLSGSLSNFSFGDEEYNVRTICRYFCMAFFCMALSVVKRHSFNAFYTVFGMVESEN